MALLQEVAKFKAERGGRTVASLEEEMNRKQRIKLQGCKTSIKEPGGCGQRRGRLVVSFPYSILCRAVEI